MADKSSAIVQGTLDMLILKTLALEPLHRDGVGIRIEQIRKQVFQVNAASLFPALRRLSVRDCAIASGARPRTARARSTTSCQPKAEGG
jgi:DNA-binding PadR family transcriptional regulator